MFSSSDTTPKVDIFSFGSILYEIFVGSPVFDLKVPSPEIIRKLKNDQMPNIPTTVSPSITRLILQCWYSDPSLRPSFDDILTFFEETDFEIVSGSDREIVRAYVRGICDWESMSLIRHPHNLESSPLMSDFLIQRSPSDHPEVIGYGAFSIVLLVDHQSTSGKFAVKRFSYRSSNESQFKREVESLSKLSHPCVLRILGYQMPIGDNPAEIHMEYAKSGSLARILKDVESESFPSFWNPTGISIIICGIVLGMRYVHSHNFIHQDLKPSNILLDAQGRSLIADFGTAREVNVKTGEFLDMGTIQYSAPELFEAADITQKADVFSFGSVLYEFLVGSRVFPRGLSLCQIVGRLENRDLPPIPSSVLPGMQKLILKCWDFDPTARPSFSDILETFENVSFQIVSGTDTEKVREYVSGILHAESLPSSEGRSFASGPYVNPYVMESRPSHRHTLIGCGSVSTVLLVEDEEEAEAFAIKQFSFDHFNQSQFFREVESLVKLNHPCILRLLRFALPTKYQPAEIHMEYAKGGSLERALKDPTSTSFWTPTGISIIICGIVLGMRFVHSLGLIHHNLKPSNILLSDQGHTLIGDFGIARNAFHDCTRSGLNGTVQYTAPEMFSSSDTTPKVDIFSFGSILYEIFVGSPVFDSNLPLFEVIRKLKNYEIPNIPTTVSPSIRSLIMQCWYSDPVLRPSFDGIMEFFEETDFEIVSGTERAIVRQYVRSICDQESKSKGERT
jgi:serine/threonine protein kinase